MIIATAGHIDHGKTSLVKALTGIDTGRLPEERARGITIDLGFARFPLPDGSTATFVDVPGHERLIRTMIAGVAGVDCALIVIAADDGIMPQTLEHLEVLDLLGVARGCVALTKIDKVDQGRVEAVSQEVAARLAQTRFGSLPIIPVSSVVGTGIETLRTALHCMHLPDKSCAGGRFRMTVDRSFTLPGAGLVVTGAVWSGIISVGDRAMLSPAGRELRIRGIHCNGATATTARAGARFALNLAGPGLQKEEFRRGAWIVDPQLHAPTDALDVEIQLAAAGQARPPKREQPVLLHLGSEHMMGRLRPIGPFREGGFVRYWHVALDRPIGALRGDRFVLRDTANASTLAGGRVIDPFAPKRRWSTAFREQLLAMMCEDDHVRALSVLAAATPVSLPSFFLSRNVTRADQVRAVESVPLQYCGKNIGQLAFGAELWTQLRERAIGAVKHYASTNPGSAATPIAIVQRALKPNDRSDIVDYVLASLVRESILVRLGGQVRLASSQPGFTSHELQRWSKAQRALATAGLRPPHIGELAVQMNWEIDATQKLLKRAEEAGLVMCVARNRYFLPETLRVLGHIAATLAAESDDRCFTASAFKDRSGIGRNISIDLLEFFDRMRLTQRQGARRCMRREVEAVFPISPLEQAGRHDP